MLELCRCCRGWLLSLLSRPAVLTIDAVSRKLALTASSILLGRESIGISFPSNTADQSSHLCSSLLASDCPAVLHPVLRCISPHGVRAAPKSNNFRCQTISENGRWLRTREVIPPTPKWFRSLEGRPLFLPPLMCVIDVCIGQPVFHDRDGSNGESTGGLQCPVESCSSSATRVGTHTCSLHSRFYRTQFMHVHHAPFQ